MFTATRRRFLGDIGYSMLAASLGSTLVAQLGAATTGHSHRRRAAPLPGDLEALIAQMQESTPAELLPHLQRELAAGTKLEMLVAAGALANARTLGGNDYEGYHAFMALLPALAMSRRMPAGQEPLPVWKVLWRNTARIRTAGNGRKALPVVDASAARGGDAQDLRGLVRARDLDGAERRLVQQRGHDSADDELQSLVQDDLNVHRTVLAWRVQDLLPIVGEEHALAVLRQIVRFCIDEERDRVKRGNAEPQVRTDVPRILDQHGLLAKPPGERVPDDAWIDALAVLVFGSPRARAADAVAAALAEGFAPDAVAEAISLAANRLLRHDTGKNRVHGASVGVHASDAANAWRNLARTGPAASRLPSLVVAAYHTAGQSQHVGTEPFAFDEELGRLETKEPDAILRAAATAIEAKDQRAACAALQRYGDLGHPAEPAFALLLRYAVSEDGALHAEKYFHTVAEEFGRTRAAFRWRHVVALARVTASEYGEPAPGVADAKKLLGV